VSLPLAAQEASSSTTYNFDLIGRRFETASAAQAKGPCCSVNQQIARNIDGREIPVESTEERVISDDGTTRVVERVTRQYTRDGRPAPPVRARIEERKSPDGTVTTATAVYRGDFNGHFQLSERSVTETRTSNGTTTTSTAIERPTINGTLEIVEKREGVKTEQLETTTVLRPNQQGRFEETARRVGERSTENGTPVSSYSRRSAAARS
jgi:hypothetical protein